ncbi:zinc transporter ZIP9-B-like [Tropilaelaps mercedesae]|uniref:Zinc transporter ZIP9-B-like n=1 Tax=Tropilaelaps mercedesae TaxID=418985 RepID=A0A1V9XZI1_9ACAR|nr:zinc transporter ZIP9-B-like [Tropilaelaps mercedesae]
MGDSWALFALSGSMFVGCYLSGLIPVSMKLSEDKINIVSILGAGLLVGTALTVIIPEGVSTLYLSRLEQAHTAHHQDVATDAGHSGHHHEAHHFDDPHALIGITLVIGFVFMLLVDQCSKGGKNSDELLPTGTINKSGVMSVRKARPGTATLGLVVHAAADGIALGAAATTTRAEIEMIVFLAIMLHKAPAAFALVSFLLHEGLDRATIKKHLLLFSAAAPILAVTTYFGISQNTKESMASMNATGIAMLFSAGTFLYVATVHVLPELAASKGGHLHHSTESSDGAGFSRKELVLLVLGAMLPSFLSFGHHH